ncbi:MAG: hypothetical protein B7Z08_09730 [Sphingomonadales bacterium 32-68-7]|nr:MAG: hypothetical protein B7Z33_00115 [Sphingomonadales bacterium 12-68-11]OYX08340.1 MAG: hypothetical protein B7Z08_09730 [Sphingomonadales bacterium 32-68-7]
MYGALAAALALGVATPAAAQSKTPATRFIEAVEKKESATVTEMLSEAGSTLINAREIGTNRTALHVVVARRDETWLNFLLTRGADANLADRQGVTPLLLACRIGFLPGVEALVAKGARVDNPNSTGETPLMYAVHRKDLQLIRVLLAAGADPDRNDNSGRSARDYASIDGQQNPVLAEIERSAKPVGQREGRGRVYGPS